MEIAELKKRLEIAIWNYEKFGDNESLMELQLAEMELNEKMEEEKQSCGKF